MTILCTRCEFDLVRVPMRLRFRASDQESKRTITCPICCGRATVDLAKFGVFHGKRDDADTYLMWQGPSLTAAKVIGGMYRITPAGARGVELSFDRLHPLDPRTICHDHALVFETASGLQPVHLPVRREFFDCLDLARPGLDPSKLVERDGSELRCRLPLKGIPTLWEHRVPLCLPTSGGGSPLQGVNVRIWPRPMHGWNRYLVGVSANTPEAEIQLAQGAIEARVLDAKNRQWTPLASRQRGGAQCVASSTETPQWISIEWVPTDGRIPAGGMLYSPPPDRTDPSAQQLDLGLDFGTSNTCVAYKGADGQPAPLPTLAEDELNLYLVRAKEESKQHAGPDLWPSGTGVGVPSRDLFPSEILLPTRLEQTSVQQDAVRSWRFGVDFGTPAPSVVATGTYRESDHTITEFKWRRSVMERYRQLNQEAVIELQAAYLEAVLLQSLARIRLKGPSNPSKVQVTYSFPLAFDDQERRQVLKAAMLRAARRLNASTDAVWEAPFEGPDESAAAASNATEDADLACYIDMGGGTTDIAIRWRPRQQGVLKERMLFSTSVHFAGTALQEAFEGLRNDPSTSCLAQGGSDELRRRVRETPRVSELRDNPQVFKSGAVSAIKARTFHFYVYVVEYVARMLAAAALDGLLTVEGSQDSQEYWDPAPIASRSPGKPTAYRVAVMFLGNGWGFMEFETANWREALRDLIRRRLRRILETEPMTAKVRDASGASPLDLTFDFPETKLPGTLHHPKQAVAFGLLTSAQGKGVTLDGKIGLVGWTTNVNNGHGQVEWFRRFGTDGSMTFAKQFESAGARRNRASAPLSPSPSDSAFGRMFPGMQVSPPGLSPGARVRVSVRGEPKEGVIEEVGDGRARVRIEAPPGAKGAVPTSSLKVASGSTFAGAPGFPGSAVGGFDSMFPGGDLSPSSVTVGSAVSFDHGTQRFLGVCRTLQGDQSLVEWTHLVDWFPSSELSAVAAPSTPGTLAAPTSMEPRPPLGVASWPTPPVTRLHSGDQLRLVAEDSPPLMEHIRHPFAQNGGLDPGLSSSLQRFRERCEPSPATGWFESAGPYEVVLETAVRANLYKVGG